MWLPSASASPPRPGGPPSLHHPMASCLVEEGKMMVEMGEGGRGKGRGREGEKGIAYAF